MSLCSHPWLFLTPRTEALTEATIKERCCRPPSLLRKESHHPPFVHKLLHCWPSESQGKLPRDRRREVRIHLPFRVNSSKGLPHLSQVGQCHSLVQPQILCQLLPSLCPCTCSFMHPAHIYVLDFVRVLRTQHRARPMRVFVH